MGLLVLANLWVLHWIPANWFANRRISYPSNRKVCREVRIRGISASNPSVDLLAFDVSPTPEAARGYSTQAAKVRCVCPTPSAKAIFAATCPARGAHPRSRRELKAGNASGAGVLSLA